MSDCSKGKCRSVFQEILPRLETGDGGPFYHKEKENDSIKTVCPLPTKIYRHRHGLAQSFSAAKSHRHQESPWVMQDMSSSLNGTPRHAIFAWSVSELGLLV